MRNDGFNRQRSNMLNKIKQLKSNTFKDIIKNPTLLEFDISQFDETIEHSTDLEKRTEAINKKNTVMAIREREAFLISEPEGELDKLKASFIEAGLHFTYFDADSLTDELYDRLLHHKADVEWMELDPIEKVYTVFIEGFEEALKDKVLARLKNVKARNYYRMFVKNIHALTLKEHINATVKYFYSNAEETKNNIFYIGESYGELAKDGTRFGALTYIDLASKSHKELVNLALVKLKMESDFVSYKLNEFVSLLKEFDAISEDDYNVFIYGTAKKRNTDLTKLGLSGALIQKLEFDKQLDNIEVDDFGHVKANEEFISYLHKQDDLTQFEINKYLPLT